MKTLLTLIILFLLSTKMQAQTNSEVRQVLLEALSLTHSTPIIYLQEVSSPGILAEEGNKEIKRGKFYQWHPLFAPFKDPVTGKLMPDTIHKDVDSLILTTSEKEYLLANINKKIVWEDQLFENSIRVKTMELGYEKWKAILQNGSKKDPNNNYYVFSFYKPVFIRKGTVCYLVLTAMCGSECGFYNELILHKVNGKWKQWFLVGGGEF